MNPQQAKQKLLQFGLGEIEADIYLYLLGKPPQTVLEISQALNIPRTSIYDNAHKLIEKGLLERILKYKSQKLRAHPIDILEELVHERQKEADRLADELQTLKNQLSFASVPTTETQVRYYHGVQGLQQMMHNSLEAEEETIGYSIYGRVEIVGAKYMKRWVKQFNEKNLRDRVITNPRQRTLNIIRQDVKPDVHQQYPDDIRYLDEDTLYVSGDTTIYNDTFAVCYWLNGEIVGCEIQNPELVRTQKSIFETLWSQAKPIEELLKQPDQ